MALISNSISNGAISRAEFEAWEESIRLGERDEALFHRDWIKPYEIKKVIFNDPATIVFWEDGTKTVVKCCDFDSYDPYFGVAMAICKKMLGNDYKKIFKKAMSFCENEEEYTKDFTKEWAKHLTRIKECMDKFKELCDTDYI